MCEIQQLHKFQCLETDGVDGGGGGMGGRGESEDDGGTSFPCWDGR